jgi:DNA-binding CsgD family transcriptional regulator
MDPPGKAVRSSLRLSERQRETAARLNLSVKTVEFPGIRMMQTLRVHSAAELAAAVTLWLRGVTFVLSGL